jgi:hypothetical protein
MKVCGASPLVRKPWSKVVVAASSTPEWLPEDALAYAGLADGNYYEDGAEGAVADLFTEDENVAEFTAATDIDSGVGLTNATSDALGPVFAAGPAATILAEATVVIDFELENDANSNVKLVVLDSPAWEYLAQVKLGRDTSFLADYVDTQALANPTVGTHRAAISVEHDRLAISIDGAAVVDFDLMPRTPTPNTVGITLAVATVSAVAIHPLALDADLPGLSAL